MTEYVENLYGKVQQKADRQKKLQVQEELQEEGQSEKLQGQEELQEEVDAGRPTQ